MKVNQTSRRRFLSTACAGTMAVALGSFPAIAKNEASKLAILGGQPLRTKPYPHWPVWDQRDQDAILPVLKSGVWSRKNVVSQAEKKFADLMGAKHCLLTTNGTHALITALRALGIEGGDEVITTPYTFVASIDAILLNNALPVFVDIDPETWQMDPDQIEAQITPNTKAILPVHILGGLCNMDKINKIAKKHNLVVVEDACEAHMSEWKNKKAGTLGDLGCFSLQNGKQITCGEGGAILGDDERIMDLCYSFHNFGRSRGKYMPKDKGGSPILGTKCRMAEYQASILMTQMQSVEEEVDRRSENAAYLTEKIRQIPGIIPRKDYEQVTRKSFYYYGFRLDEKTFGLPRKIFIKALEAEGIPANTGLGVIEGFAMHQEGVVESTISSRTFTKLFDKKRLDEYRAGLHFPKAEKLVKETIGIKHENFLGTLEDMDDIYRGILKVYENRQQLL